MILLAPFAMAACLALSAGSDRVTAADLAPAFPGLEAAPPETTLSVAPAPGLVRVFRVPELSRIAAQFHLRATPEEEICVTRTTATLEPARLLAAMRKELPGAAITILEFSLQAAPQGEIVFRRGGLRANSPSGAIWIGAVRYAPSREFTIWARVTVTTRVSRVVATRDIPPGKPIAPEDVTVETRVEFPSGQAFFASAEEVAGKISRLPIRAGAAIRGEILEIPKDVRQGEIVEVEVQDGGAYLRFKARAEAAGAVGDVIPVRNPASSRRFLAKVEGKGRVFVDGSAARQRP